MLMMNQKKNRFIVKTTLRIVAISFLIILLQSCSKISDTLRSYSESKVTLQGIVYEKTMNNPISVAGAQVQIENQNKRAFTDSNGVFLIPDVHTGLATITISHPQFDTLHKSVDITLVPLIDTFLISRTPVVRKPSFSLVRPQAGGFISNEWGFLELFIDDPDTTFSHVNIDWGDGGDSLSSTQHVNWHRYTVQTSSEMIIRIDLFDTSGLCNDTTVKVQVSVVYAPLLDGKIFFEPSQYCAPYDTAIIIGVRILQIADQYVSEIVWIINEQGPGAFLARETYDTNTGKIGDVGDVFAYLFPTAGLKGANEVQIIVSDHYGNKSSVFGSFYIAGRP